jgi:hypothetical protein
MAFENHQNLFLMRNASSKQDAAMGNNGECFYTFTGLQRGEGEFRQVKIIACNALTPCQILLF